MKEAGITRIRGQTLYTDNYYKSMALVMYTFNDYGWKCFGNFVPTDKYSCDDHDIPFLKLSNGKRIGLQLGW